MALRQYLPQKPYLPEIRVERKTPQPGMLDYIAGLSKAYASYQGQDLKMKQFEAQMARQNVLDQRAAEETEYRRSQDTLTQQNRDRIFDYNRQRDTVSDSNKARTVADAIRSQQDARTRNALVFDAVSGTSDQSVNDPYGLGVHDSQISLTEQQRTDKIREAMDHGLSAGGGIEALRRSDSGYGQTQSFDPSQVGLDGPAMMKYNQFLQRNSAAKNEQRTALEEALMGAYNSKFGDDANNFEMIGAPERTGLGNIGDAAAYAADASELPFDLSSINRREVMSGHRAGIKALSAKLAQPQAANPEYVQAVLAEYVAALEEYSGQAPGTSGGGYEASELAKTIERAGSIKNTGENYASAKSFKAQWIEDRIAKLLSDKDARENKGAATGLSLLK